MFFGYKKRYNALSLSVVPVKNPTYGGPVRISQLLHAYEKAGLDVLPICIATKHMLQKKHVNPQDIIFSKYECKKIQVRYGGDSSGASSGLADDFFSGIYAEESTAILRAIQKYFPQKCKVIFLEGPWFYGLAKRLLELPNFKNAKLIYSSLNVEYETKKTIFKSYNIENEEIIEGIYDIELESIKKSDLTICVSKGDQQHFEKMGAKRCILAPNGTAPPVHSPRTTYQQLIHQKTLKHTWFPYPLCIASSYPPNVIGFLHFFGTNLGYLSLETIIHIVGGLSDSIRTELIENSELKSFSWINNRHLNLFGIIDKHEIDVLKERAHVLLLPITIGGGSNLKTAEAIYAGKYILSSTFAFRGYEEFKDLPGVFIENDPIQFRNKLNEIIKMPPLSVDDEEIFEIRKKVLWEYTLLPVVSAINEILNKV